ncbi:hypothetical protein [Actinomycetospora aeridis]|uniref:Uncharacterized protein n=1 Tax=Actinomycetospora aeridis TaxID=3129231 RepID=A0ABU8N606_9PSEU
MAVPPRPATAGPSTASPPPVAAVPAPRSAPSAANTATTAVVDVRATDVAGVAWIVREVTHVPGVLRLRYGRLSFESTRGVLFEGTPPELALEIGRSSRSGLHVTARGERLRICVVRPAGAVPPCAELVDRAAGGRPVTSGEMDSGSVWRPLLAPDGTAASRPGARVRRALAFTRHLPRPQDAWSG